MKPHYRRKGRYKDSRQRIVIEKSDKLGISIKSFSLPKPEQLLLILSGQVILSKKKQELLKEFMNQNSLEVRDTLLE